MGSISVSGASRRQAKVVRGATSPAGMTKAADTTSREVKTFQPADLGLPPAAGGSVLRGFVENSLWEIAGDMVRADILVTDPASGMIVGRPWVEAVIDRYTRAVIGFHVSFAPPGRNVACGGAEDLRPRRGRSGNGQVYPVPGAAPELVLPSDRSTEYRFVSDYRVLDAPSPLRKSR